LIYTYECPECEEVYERESDQKEELYCGICAGDVGRDVRMKCISIRPSENKEADNDIT
jgi:hypothetical protein